MDKLYNSKKTLIAIIGVFILTVIIISLILDWRTRPPKYKDTLQTQSATQQDIIENLGQPKSQAQWKGYQILNYDSPSKWNDQFFLKDNQTVLVTRQVTEVPTETKSKYLELYGQPDLILYGPLSPIYDLYVYPQLGFAFIGSESTDELFQLWYFNPTTIADFLQTIAVDHDYSETPPVEHE